MGKSSIIERYAKGTFKENGHPVTTAVQYTSKQKIKIGNNLIELLLVDTAGNDEITITQGMLS